MKLFDFFSTLPYSLSREILWNWLEVKDVARLDSCMLNSASRQGFLDLIKSASFPAPSFNRVPSRTSFFVDWLASRLVKVSSLDFSDYFESDVTKCMQLSSTHLTSVRLKTRQEFNMIMKACTKLVKLVYATNQAFETAPLKALIAANAELQQVIVHYAVKPDVLERAYKLHGENHQSSKTMYVYLEILQSAIVAVDPPTILSHLMEFSFHALKVNATLMDNPKTVNLAMQCSQLKTLGLAHSSVDDEAILSVVTLCPQIVHLDLTYAPNITPTAIEHIALHLKVKSLILDDNYGNALTHTSLATLAQHACTTLSLLSIRSTIPKDALFKNEVSNLLRSCPALTYFGTHGLEGKNHQLIKLVKLHVSDTVINSRILRLIGKNCRVLTHLCLQDDHQRPSTKVFLPLDEKDVRYMLENCTNLRTLVYFPTVNEVVGRIVKTEFSGRIKLSKDWRDMKMSVMDQPI